ncbi:MAG TPA: SDR family NAD(P)-dependent oxidoreductase [Candidatus Polarisedimenticolia bacterium]|nr:SDR family NAD(P)-dependent oxidoreductase [Candidatus Polarisedimenticolia bacterium]
MKLTGNTIFITGGGSGIGRGLAEALHRLGNEVIISGRRKSNLDATTQANPGMHSVELDITDSESIAAVAKSLMTDYPALNVLINNAGVMLVDDAAGKMDEQFLTSTVTTNLLGPIRLTSALIEHLKKQPRATVIYNTSALAFVPLALTAVYSSTKAALHSYVLSQRYRLKSTSVRVLEIAPPWVQTDLLNSSEDPRAMPLKNFIEATIKVLGTDAEEVLVEQAKPFRNNPGPNEGALVTQFNDMMLAPPMSENSTIGEKM